MDNYLSFLPKPLLDDIAASRCVPFIGAGFSLNAVCPKGQRLPLWAELGKAMEEAIPSYTSSGPIDAISAYEAEYSRSKLVERMQELLLIGKAHPGDTHKAFSRLPFQMVVTTNVEFLLERSYESVGRPCMPIVDEDQLSVTAASQFVSLLKLHGDLHHPKRLVVTEQDYDGFLDRYPLLATFLANLLITRTALFIGYSLDDPDFRQVWQIIGERLGESRRQSYALLVSPATHVVRRYERRGVKVVALPGDDTQYSAILSTLFAELLEYWNKAVSVTSTPTEEEAKAEFLMPEDATSRLCLFSVPSGLAAQYKAVVFPIAEKHGFTPLLPEDVITPGDNPMIKELVLIRRASLAVVHASSPGAMAQLGAMSNMRHLWNGRTLALVDEKFDVRSGLAGRVLEMMQADIDRFTDGINLKRMDSWFAKQAAQLKSTLDEEPVRLLEKREYRAAVIAAVALLESALRHRLEDADPIDQVTRYSMMKLLQFAVAKEFITPTLRSKVLAAIALRNEAIHMNAQVNAEQAQQAVTLIQKILAELDDGSSNKGSHRTLGPRQAKRRCPPAVGQKTNI